MAAVPRQESALQCVPKSGDLPLQIVGPDVGFECLPMCACLLQCAAIAHCKSYAADCTCAECDQYFSGGSCACAVSATGCGEKNADECSCKTCASGYEGDGAGGCTQVSSA